MPGPLYISLTCLLILASPAFAETDGEVYEEVDKIIGEAEEGVRGNLATFIQANERPLGKARNELAELIARLNKDGRSQLATSIQKRVNTLEDTVQKRASAKVPIIEPPKKPLLERLEGKWTGPNRPEVRFFSIDGKFSQQGNGKSYDAPPTPLAVQGSKVSCKVPDGYTMTAWLIDDDAVAFVYVSPKGKMHADGEVWFRAK